jgi:hypothetical protein
MFMMIYIQSLPIPKINGNLPNKLIDDSGLIKISLAAQ